MLGLVKCGLKDLRFDLSSRLRRLLGFYFGQVFSMQKELKERIFADLMLEWHLKYGKTIKIQIMTNFLVSTVNTDAIKVMIRFLMIIRAFQDSSNY